MDAKRIICIAMLLLTMLWPAQALASTLCLGSRGDEVVTLQQALREQGYFTYARNTGYYGSITQDAVIRLQQDWGLTVDGIAGPQTQGALYGTSNTSGRTVLKYGMMGDDVRELQSMLKSAGYFAGTCTGYYGSVTYNAVIAFQRDRGLTQDGIAGPITWAALNATADTSRGTSLDRDSLYWLARIVYAEAGSEPYDGQVAVANVILNRVHSSRFPDTVYGVIFEYYKGIPQFSPVADGTIYNTPSQTAIQAAEDACEGYNPVGGALYFFNPTKAAGSWITNSCTYITTIGGHAFYK